jgi:hypothetical protein
LSNLAPVAIAQSNTALVQSNTALIVSNTAVFASGTANYASLTANYASLTANYASNLSNYISTLSNLAPVAIAQSNTALVQSNTALIVSNTAVFASGTANYASLTANYASNLSNYISTLSNLAPVAIAQSNTALVQSNLAYVIGNSASLTANYASITANSVSNTINVINGSVSLTQWNLPNLATVSSLVSNLTVQSNLYVTGTGGIGASGTPLILQGVTNPIGFGGALSDETTTLVTTNSFSLRAPFAFTIRSSALPIFSLNQLPTSSNVGFDLFKNNTTIYSAAPSIGTSATSNLVQGGTLTTNPTQVAFGDLLQAKVTSVGGGTPCGAKVYIFAS